MKRMDDILLSLILLSIILSGCVGRDTSAVESAELNTATPAVSFIESTSEAAPTAVEITPTMEPTDEPEVLDTPGISLSPDPSTSPTPSWLDLYEPVFVNYRAVAGVDINNYDHTQDTYGVLDSWDLTTWQEVTYGYTLRDLDGNGVPELIVGNMVSADDNRIHTMFTLIDGQPQRVLYSFTRSSYYLLKTGNLYHHGSSGAMFSDFLIYDYTGTVITPIYGYFTSSEISTGGYDFGFYKVTNGDRYTGNVEMISQEEFTQYLEDLEATILPLDDLSLIWIY